MIINYFRNAIFIFLCLTTFLQPAALAQNHTDKHKGIHLLSIANETTPNELQNLQDIGIEWVTLITFGFQEYYNSTELTSNALKEGSWETIDTDMIRMITSIKEAGIKIMVKPHVWINHKTDDKWRSEITQDSPQEWQAWSVDYRAMILYYAELCEMTDVDLFCVGMELYTIAKEHPRFWVELIREVREIYSGELVYAANWYEEFEQVTFWGELDYIGVQGYFPLTEKTTPSVKEIKRGWKKIVPKLQRICQQYNKPLLFTEIGYKSTTDAAIEPWQWLEEQNNYELSLKTQANCYEAFFQTFWNQSWFAGAHFWQWRMHPKQINTADFTPQGKPAEEVMRKWFLGGGQ